MVRFRALKGCLGRGCRKMWRTLGFKESRPIRRPFFMQTRKEPWFELRGSRETLDIKKRKENP